MNVRSEGTNDFEEKNHLYTIQFSSNKYATDYTIAKPVVNNENKSADNTVSPAYILASTARVKKAPRIIRLQEITVKSIRKRLRLIRMRVSN